jgi:peptide/nickel transport system ATP-binding protein
MHPYTRGLLGSMPHLGNSLREGAHLRLTEIPGMVPSLKENVPGCLFAPRCPHATERCLKEVPPLEAQGEGHWAACWESARLPVFAPFDADAPQAA